MKRCNNCGWFNLDSATHCEKCDDESFESVAESPQELEGAVPSEKGVDEPQVKTSEVVEVKSMEGASVQSENIASKEEEKSSTEGQVKRNMINATIAFGGDTPNPMAKNEPKQSNHRGLAATVMDVSAVSEASVLSNCPKCRYPLSGYMEYCPNCGVTVRNTKATVQSILCESVEKTIPSAESNVDPKTTVPIENEGAAAVLPQSSNLKATIRDMSESYLVNDSNSYKLVPEDGVDGIVIKLVLGETVVVAGRKYKFQK